MQHQAALALIAGMEFKPLPHAPFINNAVIQINDHFNLSVSYNISEGQWHVGDLGSFEVAIQVSKPGSKFRSLVQMPDHHTNTYSDCDASWLLRLINQAETLEFGGEIEVFATRTRNKERAWGHRFYVAKGHDQEDKLAYVKRVFTGEDKWRFIPAEEGLGSATVAALYRKDDGARFSRNPDGTYSMDASAMAEPYRYTYDRLMETWAFTEVEPSSNDDSAQSEQER